jgi:arginine decarboxylase
MHNLFGDTDAVDVSVDAEGRCRFGSPQRGDAVDELLRYLHFEPDDMLDTYRQRLREQGATRTQTQACLRELRADLEGYTYLRV